MESNQMKTLEIKELECMEHNESISYYQPESINEKTIIFENDIVLFNESSNIIEKFEIENPVNLEIEKLKDFQEITKINYSEETVKENIQEYVLNKLNKIFNLLNDPEELKMKDNFEDKFTIYLDLIKELITNRFPINQMKNIEIQTNVDNIYLHKLELEINNILEWNNLQEVPLLIENMSEEFIKNIEPFLHLITMEKDQIVKLQKNLEIEELQKCEMSDKFEQIITELESACDAEVEKLKLSNELLKQDLMLLKCERDEQDVNLNELRSQLFAIQLESSQSCQSGFEKENFIDASVETNDNSLSWMSNFNDALKQTISEKEDQITELMKQLNESLNQLKSSQFKDESNNLTIQELNNSILLISEELQMKDKSMQDNLDIINELEVICVEKDNRINSLEKELADINTQLEQYISAVCSMQARLEASKPNVELMLNKIDSRSNNIELLNLIDQLEKDYAEELEQSEMSKSKLEIKLNKAVQVIHKLKKQLKQSHANILKLNEEIKSLKPLYQFNIDKEDENISRNIPNNTAIFVDVSTQMDFQEENINYKGIIENLHINNFMLLKELDNIRSNDRNFRGSSLPPSITGSVNTGRNFFCGSERSVSPVSQLSSNSFEGDSVNLNQLKDLQRKIHRTTQQLNQMRVERNRIHQEYTRIRQLKEEGDQKILELLKHMDTNINQDNILHEKDQLIEMNNKCSAKIVELQAEIEMTTVRNSILETKCKKMEWKLNNQRRKYDQLVLKLDEKEQELDRSSDELRRILSGIEKDRLDWMKEKRELKLLNKSKDEKICEYRKKLSNKSKEIYVKSDNKEETVDDNTENDYILEIEQLKKQISQHKLENKQYLVLHREEVSKYKGQLEELIDDNRQLKRKLAFDQKDPKIICSDNRSTIRSSNSLIGIIDEVNESSDLMWNNTESNAILAKVVLEKENLIILLSEIEKQLNDEKQKSSEYQQEIIQLKNKQESNLPQKFDQSTHCEFLENNSNSFSQFNQHKESIDKCVQLSIHQDFQCNTVDKAIQIYYYEKLGDQFTQTNEDFEMQIINNYKTELYKNTIDKFVQTKSNFDQQVVNDYRLNLFQRLNIRKFPLIDCSDCLSYKNIEIQTETDYTMQRLIHSVENEYQSISIQTSVDELSETLDKEINLKDNIIKDSSRQILLLNDQLGRLNYELNEAVKKIAMFEFQNLDYQELISKLELDNIEIEKKYKQYIRELNLEFENYKELNGKENKLVDLSVNETHSQVNEIQLADGWDMEWEYERIANETNIADKCLVETVDNNFVNNNSQENILSKFLIELDLILNAFSDDTLIPQIKNLLATYNSAKNIEEFCNQESINNNTNILNLVAILRDEIVQLKQLLNEKNDEIGQLKGLRNQLQAELLESGQQIKDSNMEFLNLKENIQAVNVENNIFKQKIEDLEMRFKQFVNFVRMLSLDLRRLRDSSPLINESLSDSNLIDEQDVMKVTQSMEHELHKLLQQMYETDIKLQKSFNQGLDELCPSCLVPDRTERIEQLSCAIQRLQLNQKSHILSNEDNSNLHSKEPNNDHEECQNLLTDLSELLEKKQKEIEELKSRLFLATDQLIHFRTFFSDPDYKLKPEYLPLNKTINNSWKHYSDTLENDTSKQHTKVLVESEDDEQFSDSDDQLMVSQSGTTIIKVERQTKFQKPCTKELFNRICGRTKYKNFINNIKSVVLSSRRDIFFFRSQPRLNIKTLLTMYVMLIHILLFRCMFL